MKLPKKIFLKKSKGFAAFNFTPMGFAAFMLMTTIVTLTATPYIIMKKFDDKFDAELIKLSYMIDGVIDIGGFISSTVAPCSDAQTTVGLSAASLNGCQNFQFFDLIDLDTGDDDSDGAKSLYKVMHNYGGVEFYFNQDPADNTAFYLFADASALTKRTTVSEKIIASYVREKYPTVLQSIEYEAVNIDTNTGGTTTDGKVRFLLKN